jgi:hypothetical protein
MSNAQLINQDSGDYEYYTPIDIVDMARDVMGGIDLDPSSSDIANKEIGAVQYFDHNGLNEVWRGKVWMNHPFSRVNNPLWIDKLVSSYEEGFVTEACCITYAATSEVWFRPLLNYTQCFIHGRTNYYLPDGTKKTGVTKGSVVTYLGPDSTLFDAIFSRIGTVK